MCWFVCIFFDEICVLLFCMVYIDTYHNKYSPDAACLAAGACIDLVSNIVNGKCDNGFAYVFICICF